MENLGWFEYYILLLQKAFEFPYFVLDAVALLFIFSRFIPRKYLPKAGSRMNGIYTFITKYSHYVLLALVVIGMIQAPYSMYLDEQNELNKYLNEHGPELILEISGYDPWINLDTKMTGFSANLTIRNIGDRAAYQTRLRYCVANLETLEDIFAPNDWYEINPIYQEDRFIPDSIHWSQGYNGENATIAMFYAQLKYSDSQSGGHWFKQPFWYAFIIGKHESLHHSPHLEWVAQYQPIIEKMNLAKGD